jgi:hypothetical protein
MLSRATLRHRRSSRNLLARVLETPELAAQVQALPPPLLGKLIDRVGLEDAAELVGLATTEQLSRIFDDDLWRSPSAGEDPRFDAERFLLWLEIMLEGGEQAVADRLAELPEDLVTLALHRCMLVISFEDLQRELSAGDDEAWAAEKAFEGCLSEELDSYQLIWRGGDGFDTVISVLLALDRDHHSLTIDLLERSAALAAEYIADNGGLYEVLSCEEMLEQDLAAEREDRRAEQGYVAPSAAAAFLRLARQPSLGETPITEHDPLTRAYLRELSRKPKPKQRGAGGRAAPRELSALLAQAGLGHEPAAPLQLTGRAGSQLPTLTLAMRALRQSAPETFAERSEELAYLSNVLLAASAGPSQPLSPLSAVELVVDCVSFGLRLAAGVSSPTPERAAQLLESHPCDGLFRLALGSATRAAPAKARKSDARGPERVRALLTRLKI